MTLSPARVVAIQIVQARKLLALGTTAQLAERPDLVRDAEARFARAFTMIPVELRALGGDRRRIIDPTNRRFLRAGVLATHEWAMTALKEKP